MVEIANSLLMISLCMSGMVIYFNIVMKRDLSFIGVLSTSILNIITYLILVYLFLVNDFSVSSVFLNTSSLMPMKYLVSASWASHETSLLFWTFTNSIFILIWYFKYCKDKINIAILMMIQFGNILVLLSKANPFTYMPKIIKQGMGLNPVLQDIGIMIHPPMLYLAYSAYLICFSHAATVVFTKREYLRKIKNFSSFAISILSLAVGLGGWWAYRELGWGGYWYFDPVENISLLVWIFGISFHHSLIQKDMRFTSIILVVFVYMSIIWGTFFVRSGLLISIHSFAESSSSNLLLVLSILLSLYSFFVIYMAYKKFYPENIDLKYKWMQLGNLGWVTSSIIIIISLIYPLINFLFKGDMSEIKICFFEKSLLPTLAITSFLSGIIYYRNTLKIALWVVFSSFALSSIIVYLSDIELYFLFYITIAITIIFGTTYRWYEKFNDNSSKMSKPLISMFLGHISVGMIILSISLNVAFTKEMEIDIQEGNTKALWGEYKVNLKSIDYSRTNNYLRQISHITILDEVGNEVTNLMPELRLYKIERSVTSDPDIYSYLFYDWYAVINNVEDDIANIKIMQKPFISFIWFSIIIMFISFIFRIW